MRYFVLAAAMLLLTQAPAAAQNRNRQAEQTQRETRTLAIGANGSLDLETVSGNITVTGGNGRDATVEITKISRGRTDADAQTGMKDVTVEVDVRGERATVRARYPDRGRLPRDVSVTVSYVVTAPAGTRLNAHTVGGDVKINGIRGELTADTVGGNVAVTDAGQLVSALTVGGDITVRNSSSDGTLKAETVGGNIRIEQTKARRVTAGTIGGDITARDVTCDGIDIGTMSGNVEFSGPLARGGRYDVHTQSGNVHVMPSGGAGYELQAQTFSGNIRTDGSIQLRGSPSSRGPRREIRGNVGDGSAVVIARTFSGSVTVGGK
jgi:DUF4097 and DUF4098 domain-containing protein YvlB